MGCANADGADPWRRLAPDESESFGLKWGEFQGSSFSFCQKFLLRKHPPNFIFFFFNLFYMTTGKQNSLFPSFFFFL